MAFAFSKLRFATLMPMIFVGILAFAAPAQTESKIPQTLFYDADGALISNNEFVDIRMANFHSRDTTVMKTLPDGTVEFRLQKVPQEGTSAPKFSARTIDGKSLSSADLQGKVVVLTFWFIGCGVCRSMKPKLNELAAEFADDGNVVFLAMTFDEAAQVSQYLKHVPSNYQQITDAENALEKFSFSGYPKNIVISPDGKIVYWRSTVSAWDKFESVIRNELNNIKQ